MRFGVQLKALPASSWAEDVRRFEELGFSSVLVEDHFDTQWDPTVMMTGIASVTDRLRVGSLVYGVDFRHPAVVAKASATLQVMSGGRHELGIGAGWSTLDYGRLGLSFDRASIRIERLSEAIEVIRQLWTEEEVTYQGAHYQIDAMPRTVDLGSLAPPKVLVGGGGPKLLSLAGRLADIVGINPTIPKGDFTADSIQELTHARAEAKIDMVRAAASEAGRDLDAIELSALAFVTKIEDKPSDFWQRMVGATGLSEEQIAQSPYYLVGSPAEVRERLIERRGTLGINYVVVQDGPHLAAFAEGVVQPLLAELAGQ